MFTAMLHKRRLKKLLKVIRKKDTSLEAINKKDVSLVARLLRKLVDINTLIDKNTLLNISIREGSVEIIKLMLASGVDINKTDGYGYTPIYEAVASYCWGKRNKFTVDKDLEIINLLIDSGADVNKPNSDGNTSIDHAINYGIPMEESEIISLLIERGADVNGGYGKKIRLTIAANICHRNDFRRLLESGALVDEQNFEGKTSLMEAASVGREDIVELLIKFGADIKISDENNMKTYDWAIYGGSIAITRILFEHANNCSITEEDLQKIILTILHNLKSRAKDSLGDDAKFHYRVLRPYKTFVNDLSRLDLLPREFKGLSPVYFEAPYHLDVSPIGRTADLDRGLSEDLSKRTKIAFECMNENYKRIELLYNLFTNKDN